jgi:hypothetical protein
MNINNIEKHHLIIASHFTYGWMPTILSLDLFNEKDILAILNEVKGGKLLDAISLSKVK